MNKSLFSSLFIGIFLISIIITTGGDQQVNLSGVVDSDGDQANTHPKKLQQSESSISQEPEPEPEPQSNIAYTEAWLPYRNLTNGFIEQNNLTKVFRASVSTAPSRLADLSYYQFERINANNFYLKSVYGQWLLSKTNGVLLLNKQNQTIYDSEEWSIVYQGSVVTPISESIELKEKNSDNLTIWLTKEYTAGKFVIEYKWIKGYLKITAGLKANANIIGLRIALQITGLEQFSKQDLVTYNASGRYLDFKDMLSQIDEAASSFSNGQLVLVSKAFNLQAGQTKVLDPTSYSTNDADDLFMQKSPAGAYSGYTTGSIIAVGNYTSNNYIHRGSIRFPLSFIDPYSTIQSAYVNLTVRYVHDATVQTNISLLGLNTQITPFSESSTFNSSTFGDYYLNNGSNYNSTLRLGSIVTPAVGSIYYWATTDFVQEWVNTRSNTDYIGWQIRQLYDDTIQNEIEFRDAQTYPTESPSLTITWATDTTPPSISSNQTSDWTNDPYVKLDVFDQPASNPSGLNLSTLAYSQDDGATWVKVPEDWKTISDNETFPTTITVDLSSLLIEGANGNIWWRLADTQGNWGYSQALGGETAVQYYPKFTGTYALENTTAQLGWSEAWTETTTGWAFSVGGSPTISLDTGIYGNAIKFQYNQSSTFEGFVLGVSSIDLRNFDTLSFWVKSNATLTWRTTYSAIFSSSSTKAGISVTNSHIISKTSTGSTTSWNYITLAWGSETFAHQNGDLSAINWIIPVELSGIQYSAYTVWIDGIHFESSDYLAENLTNLVYYGGAAWNSAIITTNTTSNSGYESIKYDINDGGSDNYPQIYFYSNIDISNFDTFTIDYMTNKTLTVDWVRFIDGNANELQFNTDFSTSTSFQTKTFDLSSGVQSGTFNSSDLFKIVFRILNTSNYTLFFDGISFYQSDTEFNYDSVAPELTLDSLTEELPDAPWDHLYCNSTTYCFYTSQYTVNSSITYELTYGDATSGVEWLNVTVGFGDLVNTSISNNGTLELVDYLETGESATTVTWTLYDQAGNSDTVTITFEADDLAPTSISISTPWLDISTYCSYIDVPNITDAESGFYNYALQNQYYQSNYTESGFIQFCGMVAGVNIIQVIAYDQVGNKMESNLLFIRATLIQQETHTLTTNVNHIANYQTFVNQFFQVIMFILISSVLVMGLVVIYRRYK